VSIGDFVLSGGELAAAMVLDAVTRLLPGALGNEASSQNESFSRLGSELEKHRSAHGWAESPAPTKATHTNDNGGLLLDFPHYTRPAEFRGWGVPEVLIGGNHAQVTKWRREAAVEKTRRNRPDLLLPRVSGEI
jgi:tRNA (guanine37-N1)-methyltransferase